MQSTHMHCRFDPICFVNVSPFFLSSWIRNMHLRAIQFVMALFFKSIALKARTHLMEHY